MRKITFAEWKAELLAQGVGHDDVALVCPMCRTAQSRRDFRAAGVAEERIGGLLGFACVGRFTGAKPPRKEPDGQPCDWSLGGLLQLHELEVTTPVGVTLRTFVPATPEEAKAHAAAWAQERAVEAQFDGCEP